MKNDWKIITVSALMSAGIVGLITDFKFHDIVFSLGNFKTDTSSSHLIYALTILLYIWPMLFKATKLIAQRNKILSLIICIVNPILLVLITYLTYLTVSTFGSTPARANYLVISILTATIVTQVVIQLVLLKELRRIHSW